MYWISLLYPVFILAALYTIPFILGIFRANTLLAVLYIVAAAIIAWLTHPQITNFVNEAGRVRITEFHQPVGIPLVFWNVLVPGGLYACGSGLRFIAAQLRVTR